MMIRGTLLLMLAFMGVASHASPQKKTYIIHMDNTKLTEMKASLERPNRWYESVLESITQKEAAAATRAADSEEQGAAPEVLYVYENTMTGFAARLSAAQAAALSSVDGVLLANPDELLQLHTTFSTHFLGLEKGVGLWNKTSLASDVIVGVFDTGIWPEHVSFSDAGMPRVPSRWKGGCESGTNFTSSNCNRKIIGARAFYEGYEAISGRINETKDFRSPRDSNGHGTHTASTAAGGVVAGASLFGLAKGFASGMRYTSRIAAYKVCYSGGCATSDILAAIDKAVADGVDIMSLSLGGAPRPYYADSMAIASLGATQNGILVSCSAGNSGPYSFTVGNSAPWLMTIGASYVSRGFPARVKIGNGRSYEGTSLYQGRPTKQLPLVYKETAGSSGAEFCIKNSLSSKLVKGKIVLCERGINDRTEKGELVKKAGGAGMLLLNNANSGEELIADAHLLPASALGAKAAKSIKSYLALNKNLTASITFKGTKYGYRAPVMAAFSSRGPSSFDPYVIKPDITGPGVNILAAWPPIRSPTELDGDKRRVLFNIVSGTSMSCPHLSGVAALVKSVHKDWSPAAIKSALMTTSCTHDDRGGPMRDAYITQGHKFATPFAFGSGHVDPERASDPGLIYDITVEEYLNYLCSINYTTAQVSLVARRRFHCPRSVDSGDLNYPSFALLFSAGEKRRTVTYTRTVTNVGSAGSTYIVFVSRKPVGVFVDVSPKVLKFKSVGEKQSYKVRFTGFGRRISSGAASFGSIVWVGGKHIVRSPIAVVWQ